MNSPIIYQYQNNPISFDFGGEEKMINATEMIKGFPSKKINNFTRSKQTIEYIKVLESKTQKSVLLINHGGNNAGTWMHEKLALKFAAWLSPSFELWVYDKIDELVKTGRTELNNVLPTTYADALRQLADKVEENEQLRPKAEYTDKVLQSSSTYTITQIAKELGYRSGKALNNILESKGIQYKQSGSWLLCADYCGKDYTSFRTHEKTNIDTGEVKTYSNTVWTETGRNFIHSLLNQKQVA